MRKLLASMVFLTVASVGLAWLLASSPHQEVDAATSVAGTKPVVSAGLAPGRIAIGAGQLREAYRQGLIDHPIKTILDIRQPMSYGDFIWNDKGVAPGPAWIRIDLNSQLLSVFRSGHEIGTAVVLYGADGLPTPTGKFPILAKLKNHRSSTYDAPMPYTLRLTGDGVSIHGSNVRWGFATHGCIGVPAAFAAKLFDVVRVGDEVLIVSAKRKG